jgi:hypothetical protein
LLATAFTVVVLTAGSAFGGCGSNTTHTAGLETQTASTSTTGGGAPSTPAPESSEKN